MRFASIFLCLMIVPAVFAGDVVMMDEPYYKAKVRNTELIYTEQNLPFAQYAAGVELALQPLYEKMYGYTMDEPLSVVLTSEYNQVPNGFSTQYPNNRQVNYIGGALLADYFSATSWLDTLLYHETAHNYQMNAKDNPISSTLHSVLANGAFFIPWFTVPNSVESSFMAEGNAVLNESWHGKGGRLYSGQFKAETLMQAKAGYLTPERLYNSNYFFLYGSHFYTLGGFYHYYLAQTYGLQKTNDYWKKHSYYWFWPFFTNDSMREAVGQDFETTLGAWRKKMEAESEAMVQTKGETVASSQFLSPMNGDAEQIYFVINKTGRDTPELVVYDKRSGKVTKKRGSWLEGKVVRTGSDAYATQSSNFTNPWRIYIGLYDGDAQIVEGTRSKVVEGYLSDGRAVTFDVPSSYRLPQMYVGGEFYAQTTSSVFIDGDDLYYFVQKDKTRTLYKNKTALTSLQGYYGHVVGVDSDGGVFFIANTEHGSGLFRFRDGKSVQMHPADTIVDARLIDDTHALVAAVGSDAYTFEKVTLSSQKEAPYEVRLFVEDEPYYRAADTEMHPQTAPKLGTQHRFIPPLDMRYSAANVAMGVDDDAGFVYDVSVNFADPLTLNSLGFFIGRGLDEYTLGGAAYSNSQYFIDFSLTGYGVIDRPDNNTTANENDYGLFATAAMPFWRQGYYNGTLNVSYYEDYEADSRKPLSTVLLLNRYEQYGVSMYPNFLLGAEGYYSSDRGTNAYGGKLRYAQGYGHEVYAKASGKYVQSDAQSALDSRGIKVSRNIYTALIDGDPTAIVMPSLKETGYVKNALKTGVELRKVFNAHAYYFTFPVSLRRESLYAGYNYYRYGRFTNDDLDDNEGKIGMLLDTLWMNVLPIPMTLEYRYNDNKDIAEEHNFRLFLGISL